MDDKRRGKKLMGEKEGMEVESYRELRGVERGDGGINNIRTAKIERGREGDCGIYRDSQRDKRE